MKRVIRLSTLGLALALLALASSPVRAQARKKLLERMYELYNSSSTSEPHKRFLERAIKRRGKVGARRAGLVNVSAAARVRPAGIVSAAAVRPQALSADSTFRLVDVYSFPNPARGKNKPTIRAQVGLADSVEIRIYDISGRLAHSVNLAAPQILDDNNGKGPQYTYDYMWDTGGVGSGVYIYAVTAKKAGASDIRVTKKIGVIK